MPLLTLLAIGYQCEVRRYWGEITKVTSMAFRKIPRTAENMRLAEIELDQNPFGYTEDQIAEERKTLEWVRQQIEEESQAQGKGWCIPTRSLRVG